MAKGHHMNGAFLVNASRSGSTMMSTILRQHPDVLSLSEFMTNQGARALLPGKISGKAYWQQLAKPTRLMRHLVNPNSAPNEFLYHTVTNQRFDPFNCPPILAVTLPHLFERPDEVFDDLAKEVAQLPEQKRSDHHRAVIDFLCVRTGQGFWVERSGGTLLATAELARNFPEAKFVLMLRDGRDVTLSMQNYKPARFVVWFWKRAKSFGVDIFKPGSQIGSTSWIAFMEKLSGQILPFDRILKTKPSLADTAACWSALTANGLKQFQKLPVHRRQVIRYENVVHSPRSELSRLAEHLELPNNSSWLDFGSNVPRKLPPRHLSLPLADQRKLNALTAVTMELADQIV